MKEIEKTAIGWEVNLMYILLQVVDVLVEDIDWQLRLRGNNFKRELKQSFKRYTQKQKDASYWLHDIIGVDRAFWEATEKNSKKYSNSIADAHELLRMCMLYMDRSHTEDGYYQIMRFLRSLPNGGLFPDEFVARFNFNRAWVYEKGDRIHNDNHGNGILDLDLGNSNWQCVFDNGDKAVLNESQFKLA